MRTLLMAVIFFTTTTQAQTLDSGDLNGIITDAQQQLVQNATIRIHGKNLSTHSNQHGEFSFAAMQYGHYKVDVEVSNSQHYNTTVHHQGDVIVINIDNLQLDDLVVSANPLEHNQLKMTTPVAILSEEDLVMDRGLSIDQTLGQITGVNSGSFGVGAGQIVIRGQQGPRVTVLNNNVTNQDAASVSPDHWISTEPLLAKQIEVLKGPATLLYGGGAVGGVVNVVDDVIPTTVIDGFNGGIEGRLSDSAVGERAGVISVNGALTEDFMAHVSYFNSQTDDYQIPGHAESAVLHQAAGHADDSQGAHEEGIGLVENSAIKADGFNFGISRVSDRGYLGVSFSDFNRNYGIPGHDHGDEDHEADEAEHDEAHVVRIDLDKSVFNIKGLHQFDEANFISQLRTHYSNTDYQHIELEGTEVGTVFDNQADEFRLELTHGTIGGFEGVWGLQWTNRDFSAIGVEAYILPSTTQISSVFLIEERDFDRWHAEFGFRYDEQSVDTQNFSTINDSALSLSLGATFDLDEHWTLPINLTSAQRLPTAEEYFSNQGGGNELIAHLATNAIEIGNPDLQQETANNFDVGLKYRNAGFSFNLAVYYNQIDDYIYLRDSGTVEDGTRVFMYTQQNATFKGFETDVSYQFADRFNSQWDLRLFADGTNAELNTGVKVPRIPAKRVGLAVNWLHGPWSIGLQHTHVSKQQDLAPFELPSDGYELLDLSANWLRYGNRFETLLFIKAKNLLDEEIRDHASFIKDIAPRPGRSLSAGFRLTF